MIQQCMYIYMYITCIRAAINYVAELKEILRLVYI